MSPGDIRPRMYSCQARDDLGQVSTKSSNILPFAARIMSDGQASSTGPSTSSRVGGGFRASQFVQAMSTRHPKQDGHKDGHQADDPEDDGHPRACGLACHSHAHLPVCPNPPDPRPVRSRTSSSFQFPRAIWTRTPWAIRSPRFTLYGELPRLTSSTFTSPL